VLFAHHTADSRPGHSRKVEVSFPFLVSPKTNRESMGIFYLVMVAGETELKHFLAAAVKGFGSKTKDANFCFRQLFTYPFQRLFLMW